MEERIAKTPNPIFVKRLLNLGPPILGMQRSLLWAKAASNLPLHLGKLSKTLCSVIMDVWQKR
jgi:hypothetical protein